MAQVNTCLKRIFFIFNVFFAIIGGVILLLTLLSQVITNNNGGDEMEGRTAALIILYVVGTVTLIVAALGAYGAHKESKVALIIFLVCMVIGSLLMLRFAIPVAIARPLVMGAFEDRLRSLLPLDNAPAEVKDMANTLQEHMHCCGLFSYTDWENNIPKSCECNNEDYECKTISYRTLMYLEGGSKRIYAQTCYPIMMHYLRLVFDISIGIVFTLAALALLGMALSSIMIHQINSSSRPTIVVPAFFTTAPPKYQELQNTPQY